MDSYTQRGIIMSDGMSEMIKGELLNITKAYCKVNNIDINLDKVNKEYSRAGDAEGALYQSFIFKLAFAEQDPTLLKSITDEELAVFNQRILDSREVDCGSF